MEGGDKWVNASKDPEQIRAWWAQWPDANPAIGGNLSGNAVMDNDHGLKSYEDFIAWRDRNGLPPTYTVHTGRRDGEYGVHMYYAGAMDDVQTWELDGCSGQIKSVGGYVMGAGSIHPDSGEKYEVIDDSPLAPLPSIISNLKTRKAEATNNAKVLKTKWSLPVHSGENRTGFLLEQCGNMRNLGCGYDAILAHMEALNRDPEIIADPVEQERLESTARNCAKFPLPEQPPAAIVGKPVEPLPEAKPKLTARPVYAIEVWDGTAVGEFAKLCAHDNNIPRKLFAEAFLTVLGAVVGDRLVCHEIEGAHPRRFTNIIAPKGKGKGTAIRRAVRFFAQNWNSAWCSVTPGFLSGGNESMWKPKGIGAWMSGASSVPGMARLTKEPKDIPAEKSWGNTLPRILSVHEEMKTFLSTLFIEGGVGSGMEGVVCQLWDDLFFNGTATGTRDAVYGEMMFSLLCGITEEDWFDLLSKGNAVGGGLMSRFNIIGTEGHYENVGKMKPPDLVPLQETFLPRIAQLADAHANIRPSEAAETLVAEWTDNLPDDCERLNLHVWRNAVMLAWLKHEEQISEATILDAIKLGDYQVHSHEYYRTDAADNATAKVQAKIMRALSVRGAISKRELQQYPHAQREGTDLWNRGLDGLLKYGQVARRADGKLYKVAEV